MKQFDRLKQYFGVNRISHYLLKEHFSTITGLFSLLGNHDQENAKLLRSAFNSLVYPLLVKNGTFNESSRIIFRQLLEEFFDSATAETHLHELTILDPLPPDEAVAVIKDKFPEKQQYTAEFLVILTAMLNVGAAEVSEIRRIAEKLGMSHESIMTLHRKIKNGEKRRQRLRNSSRGIMAALLIVLIFLLTAKYLQSVIFGLLLACIMLPIEKFFEKRLVSGKSIFCLPVKFVSLLGYPLIKISQNLTRKNDSDNKKTNISADNNRAVIKQSITLTIITAIIIAVIAWLTISKLTGHFMSDVQQTVRQWNIRRVQPDGSAATFMDKCNFAIEQLRQNFESLPVVQYLIDHVSKIINDPAMREQMLKTLLRSSGGIINFTGGVLNIAVSLACDLLLTVFFALLFLLKMAEFSGSGKNKHSGSEYVVRSFFNGIWLPGADENVIRETCRIVDGIVLRLKIWLKGYLTLILVDSTVYTTCFFFLGVPFFLLLGVIAGCGIALPYLGPVISCCITLLVTTATGMATGEILLAIIICYLIYNGIVEQFILYPAVIGESLGLSTLETIIVVLLGAVFAGIPGMIFALPAASVIKYLIPQIYHGFATRRK